MAHQDTNSNTLSAFDVVTSVYLMCYHGVSCFGWAFIFHRCTEYVERYPNFFALNEEISLVLQILTATACLEILHSLVGIDSQFNVWNVLIESLSRLFMIWFIFYCWVTIYYIIFYFEKSIWINVDQHLCQLSFFFFVVDEFWFLIDCSWCNIWFDFRQWVWYISKQSSQYSICKLRTITL